VYLRIFQAADSLFLIAESIKVAGSTDKDAMAKALRGMKYTGARGTIEFSQEPGFTFQQWVEVPYVTYQLTEVNQKIGDAPLVQAPGMPLDPTKLKR
jgi:branched-chain amino acid transport system substrate-binding protein